MNCNEAISLIHEYLDGELMEEQTECLKKHLQVCEDCAAVMEELTMTESLIKNIPIPSPSKDLSERILAALPKAEKPKKAAWFQQVRRYPALTAAAVFIVLMMTSLFNLPGNGQELVIRGNDLDQLEITGNHVVVPEGSTINGNLVIENGTVQVDGNVEGDVTVIDGSLHLASTAAISGKATQINQWIDRLWFKLYDLVKKE